MDPWFFGMLGTGDEMTTGVATTDLATVDRPRDH
jgi:hypothetical protein